MSLANDYAGLSEDARSALDRRYELFIGGEWRAPAASGYHAVFDPSHGGAIASVATADETDVDAAVAAARLAFDEGPWPRMRPHEREALILRLADLIGAQGEALSQIETVNSGKLLPNTRAIDVGFSITTLRYMAGWSTKIAGKTLDLSVPYAPGMAFTGFTRLRPVGVVAGITPWNVPLCEAVFKLAPVLATGCTVVIKPAEQTPLTTLALARLCQEAGVPPGVVNVITGGREVGAALVAHPDVDKINFTGSTAAGRQIAAVAAPQMKKYNLELGGKSPVVIAADADLDLAIPGAAWAILGNHGQNCCAGSRLYVHASLFDRVIEGVAEIARAVRIGPGLDPASQMGPMVNHAHRDRVLAFVEEGRRAGASLVYGGESVADPGAYLNPALLVGLPHENRLVQEEIFGPVLVAERFEEMDAVMARVNGTSYGLGASIWSRDFETINRFFDRVEAGIVWINNHNTLDPAVPFGGWKESGVGMELGEEGLMSHLRVKAGVVCRA
ncbi:aldehyde dehydrogenase family protein [Flavisphingomonas formosensis]|uniref:aldehyde dehydrogenase family protein n=1 Tax=Flavisphingomonas formosensis TaxID=861534 RepID=UPI0012F87F7C|nr:aldehyde dehydrogenase family protein [Sphingomonas formosensis]